ncbi:hypothetical protein GGF32_006639 [Allomyces javanicus]|nr:hypothetical protein GGF32_006639 [Allomyces javanicus]
MMPSDLAIAARVGWPVSLVHLDLSHNDLETLPPTFPPRLRTLDLSGNPLHVAMASDWIAALPPMLQSVILKDVPSAEGLVPLFMPLGTVEVVTGHEENIEDAEITMELNLDEEEEEEVQGDDDDDSDGDDV